MLRQKNVYRAGSNMSNAREQLTITCIFGHEAIFLMFMKMEQCRANDCDT